MNSALTSRPLWQRGLVGAVAAGIIGVLVLGISNAAQSGSVQVPKTMNSKTLVDLTSAQMFGACVFGLIIATVLALILHRVAKLSARVPLIFGIGTLLSLASPLMISGATRGTKATLVLMHLVCGAIAVSLLGRRPT